MSNINEIIGNFIDRLRAPLELYVPLYKIKTILIYQTTITII